MAPKRKLQVFISSTFTDMQEQRQAAVETILTRGHIPAGMELFAAGDETQMQVIRRWIEESDVFLLILGARYGSVEPATGKSYIHLEYEYALSLNKPFFAIVMDERHMREMFAKLHVDQSAQQNYAEYVAFRNIVLSRMVDFWTNPDSIRLAIHKSMSDFERRDNLVGWIPGSEAVNVAPLAEELARLGQENVRLKDELTRLNPSEEKYNGLNFDQLYTQLSAMPINSMKYLSHHITNLGDISLTFGDREPTALHALVALSDVFAVGGYMSDTTPAFSNLVTYLERYALVTHVFNPRRQASIAKFTEIGIRFMNEIRLRKDVSRVQTFILPAERLD